MRVLIDEKGIALLTSLMFTLISLTIIMALLYMITTGTQVSSATKRYRTVLMAGYGGTEVVTKDIIKKVFEGYSTSARLQAAYSGAFLDSDGNSSLTVNSCINQKFTRATSTWDAACQPTSTSPKNNPDITFLLQATTNSPFRVYAKVVDTFKGNTDTANNSNLKEALNVTESTAEAGLTIPSSYRIEVQTERSTNPQEKANLSVLYAY